MSLHIPSDFVFVLRYYEGHFDVLMNEDYLPLINIKLSFYYNLEQIMGVLVCDNLGIFCFIYPYKQML